MNNLERRENDIARELYEKIYKPNWSELIILVMAEQKPFNPG